MAQLYHIRKINGSAPPVPASLKISKMALDKDSYRAASGKLIRNKITDKMKFELSFPTMNKTDLTSLMSLFNSDSFTVEYENIVSNTVVTGTFYHGDISIEPYWIQNEANTEVLYKPFSVNLIEY